MLHKASLAAPTAAASRTGCVLRAGPAWRRRSVAAAGVSARASPDAAAVAVLPDARRRELETAARRAAYAAQRSAEIEAERSGIPWWEVDCPPNMVNVSSLSELLAAVEAEARPGGRLVVVNFFAPECYACKSMQPKLRQIAAGAGSDVLFLKVNGLTGDLQAYCEAMGITKIPYFHFYRANRRVAEFSANMRPEKLALLRAELAAHRATA